MKTLVCLLVVLSSGCATGYGTLAGMGVGILIGAIGSANTHDTSYVGQGAALGALIGVAAAGTASLVAHNNGRQEAQMEARLWAEKRKEERAREENYRVLEAIRRERAALGRPAPQVEPSGVEPQEQLPAQ